MSRLSEPVRVRPEDVIGKRPVRALMAAGYEIVDRVPREARRWTCPHCGAVHAPKFGERADVYADWGLIWHRLCVDPGQTAPSKRGDRRAMIEERVALPWPVGRAALASTSAQDREGATKPDTEKEG